MILNNSYIGSSDINFIFKKLKAISSKIPVQLQELCTANYNTDMFLSLVATL